ncbi:MAG: hypothetical protein A3D31_14460 [Candidatus Fluviicola riflensis]|nr:MAG: amidohydrolase [Candidatus Fluviicola riflensis]OGS78171.1 MAG: hypothetical protein A3D31_14460 [Candidatus Fluviicola riflensis]OGS85237.1 MAG: hypothetical protein A2724_11395 [Fluviicola sp. RIFCSPHIGHO2_01_FULL_43_53]OGS89508.1 MAG: hypothetical protein A3E30_05700 [Fluviicola sp. RIFCSPHIGHO2_12_FULL_43_24]
MRDLRITLAQVDQVWEDKAANLRHFEEILASVSETDLIVLPEMFHTAFSMSGEALAETMDNSEALRWLQRMAREKNAAFYTSFIARDQGKLFNRGVFVEPSGTVHIYDKRKTFGLAGENAVYTAGTSEQIVDYLGWKINLQICYDLRFPENVRNGLLEDGSARYDLLIYIANWPERRASHWKTLLKARAIENQCYVAGVNRVGTDALELSYSGDSVVHSALGEEIAQLPANEAIHTIGLSPKDLHEVREKLPFLSDSSYRLFNR